jgi:hypothetical protein
MFESDDEHCRRCGADRKDAVRRQMRDLCYTYTGDEPEDDEIARMVKPIYNPKWGKPQWYEKGDGEASADDDGDPEAEDSGDAEAAEE